MEVAFDRERPAAGALLGAALLEPLSRTSCLLERVGPRALQHHDLGAVHEADSGVRHHLRLLGAPAREVLGPLPGAADLEDALAERDRVAVHDARGARRELAGDDGDHRLVHQPQTVLDAAEADEGVPLLVDCEREEIPVPEPGRDRSRLGRSVVRRLGVAFDDVLEHRRDDEIASLDAVGLLGLEHALRPPEPAARRPDCAVCHQVQSDPEGTAHRADGVAGLEVRPMRALEDTQVLVVEREHVGGDREALEVLCGQRDFGVGGDERHAGLLPATPIEQGACGLHVGAGHAGSMRRSLTFHPHSSNGGTRLPFAPLDVRFAAGPLGSPSD